MVLCASGVSLWLGFNLGRPEDIWYSSGGAPAVSGVFIVRSDSYGAPGVSGVGLTVFGKLFIVKGKGSKAGRRGEKR